MTVWLSDTCPLYMKSIIASKSSKSTFVMITATTPLVKVFGTVENIDRKYSEEALRITRCVRNIWSLLLATGVDRLAGVGDGEECPLVRPLVEALASPAVPLGPSLRCVWHTSRQSVSCVDSNIDEKLSLIVISWSPIRKVYPFSTSEDILLVVVITCLPLRMCLTIDLVQRFYDNYHKNIGFDIKLPKIVSIVWRLKNKFFVYKKCYINVLQNNYHFLRGL